MSCNQCDENPKLSSKENNSVAQTKTDNKQTLASCPFRMADGRNFTDYRTQCTLDYQRKTKNNFKSSYEERQFMIHNASNIIKDNVSLSEKMNQCSGCYSTDVPGTMLPERNMVQCNDKKCNFTENNPSGLGTGRNYN
jgi:hypothetical protein